jgi:serine/threonine protein phosphatase PrpC
MLSLKVAILSEPGGRKYNEDACGYRSSDRQFCCVLADGAGGHGGGDVASRLAVQSLLARFSETPSTSGTELSQLVRLTNQVVLAGRTSGTILEQMYSTIVCLVIDFAKGSTDWVHSGDSRLYWFRDRRLVERTRDHSFVESLVDAGLIRPDETHGHPKRSVLRSALGNENEELELGGSSSTRIAVSGDVFLLCSDGVWEHLPDDSLERLLCEASTPEEWLAGIEKAIFEATRELKSYDNYTALAIWLSDAAEV